MEVLFPGLMPEGGPPPWAPRAKLIARVAAVAITCGVIVGASIGFAGSLGLVIATDTLAGVGLLVLVTHTPRADRGQSGITLADVVSRVTGGRLPLGRRNQPPVRASDFPTFLKISSDLGWASVSGWHYDHGTRPLLVRVMKTALAERHQLDVASDPARARQLVGEDIWPYLDPYSPPAKDSRVPGVDPRTLARIVDRLEHL
jgi:hypothetical protein